MSKSKISFFKRFIVKSNIKYFFNILLLLVVLVLFTKCQRQNRVEAAIKAIPINLEVERFEQEFYKSGPSEIPKLKEKYPYLFSQQFNDTVWIARQQDSLQQLLVNAVDAEFSDFDTVVAELERLFQHIQYYFPETKVPRIITLTNDVDYQMKTVYLDSLLLVSLDTFLGKDHEFYEGISKYIRRQMDVDYLSSHIAEKFAETRLPNPKERTLLAQMIYHGKILYLKDLLLPHTPDAFKMGYDEEQHTWIVENERYIWQYFIEKELLYQTHPSLRQRFIDPAPFTKFYLEIDNESPGEVGRWMGWQMVRSYAKRYPEVPLNTLLTLPAQLLFNASGYKPKR